MSLSVRISNARPGRLGAIGVFLVTLALALSAAHATTITIVNLDGPGEGFNDLTAAIPVGGNTGTTVGDQRLQALQYGADLWAAVLNSDVEIQIEASFDDLSCSPTSGLLGLAGPQTLHANFSGAPSA